MKKTILLTLFIFCINGFSQINLVKTVDLDYPISRIIHFPKCGDSPIYLCKKSDTVNIIINDGIKFEMDYFENLLYADHNHLYTTTYNDSVITLKKYEEKDNTYKIINQIVLPKMKKGAHYYVDIEMTDDHLFYFAYQPNTSSVEKKLSVDFYDADLKKAFTITEDLAIYNIHCFGMDSVLLLKENILDKTLSTHLYNHSGKLLSDESFHLAFKPSTQSSIADFLKNDGVIFTLVQTDTLKTHVMKFDHSGKMLWDEVLNENYFGFLEFGDQLVTYGGGNFTKPDYKLLYIDEIKGTLSKEIDIRKYFTDYVKSKKLVEKDHSFVPFSLNVNPEHSWLSFVMSIYNTKKKNVAADRIIVFDAQHDMLTLDIDLDGNEHPKVVPTDQNHLIVGLGKKVSIYKVN